MTQGIVDLTVRQKKLAIKQSESSPMAKVSAKNLTAPLNIEDFVQLVQQFTSQIGEYGGIGDIYSTSKSFKVADPGATFNPSFSTSLSYTGKFKCTIPRRYSDIGPRPEACDGSENIFGPISGFSANLKPSSWGRIMGDGVSGTFKITNLGSRAIDFQDFLSDQPSAATRSILKGNDQIIGSNQGDVIKGFDGNDQLFGGKGVNKLYGGKGKDVFHLDANGVQLIMDFDADEDSINLPGNPKKWAKYATIQKSKKQILLGYAKDDVRTDYLLSIKSNSPIAVDDISLI